jgi:hypothetical protein
LIGPFGSGLFVRASRSKRGAVYIGRLNRGGSGNLFGWLSILDPNLFFRIEKLATNGPSWAIGALVRLVRLARRVRDLCAVFHLIFPRLDRDFHRKSRPQSTWILRKIGCIDI